MASWDLRTTINWYYVVGILLLISLELTGVGFLNYWRNDFYTSIELKQLHRFLYLLGEFTVVASGMVLVYANKTYLINKFALKMRTSWTLIVQNKWIKIKDKLDVDNPAQRINQDIMDFWDMGMTLGTGFFQSILEILMFTVIILLNTHSAPLILLVSYSYAAIIILITYYKGRILIGLNFILQKCDADHRFGLTSISNGIDDSLHDERIEKVKDAGMQVIKKQKVLSFFTSTATQISVVLPFLILAPLYFSGGIKFGVLFQLASAMGSLQLALSYVIDSYPVIVKFQATYHRVKFVLPLLED